MDQLLAVGGTEIPADSYIEPEQFYLMSMYTFYIPRPPDHGRNVLAPNGQVHSRVGAHASGVTDSWLSLPQPSQGPSHPVHFSLSD